MVPMSRTSVYFWCFLSCVACVGHASEVPSCSADSTPWKETDDETEPAIQMLQLKGVSSSRLAEFTMVGVNQTSACTAKFKVQTSDLVVKEVTAKRSGYHVGDMASDQNILSLAVAIKSLKVIGCCEVTVFTKLNYQGESKVYKQGAHTDILGPINSVRLTPAICVSPVWKEWAKNCKDILSFNVQENAKSRIQSDQRKCTVQSTQNGACRNPGGKGDHRPWSCMNDNSPKQKDYGEEFCKKSCMEMKGLAVGFWYRGTSLFKCECFLPGPRDAKKAKFPKGPKCPCGWKSQKAYPASFPPSSWKRGATRARPGVAAGTKCAVISCVGPEPTAPPISLPHPGFQDFKDCSATIPSNAVSKSEGFFAVGRILADNRKCTAGPRKVGACRDKKMKGYMSRHATAHSCHFYPPHHYKGDELKSYKEENCTQACIAMKAMAAQTEWNWDTVKQKKKDETINHCDCYFAGPKGEYRQNTGGRGPKDCPCGWVSNPGYPWSNKKLNPADRYFKRGELWVADNKEPTAKDYPRRGSCTMITCDGPDPFDPSVPAPAPPPVPLTSFWTSLDYKPTMYKYGEKCSDTSIGRAGLQAMQEFMKNKRKCTAQPMKKGKCADKNNPPSYGHKCTNNVKYVLRSKYKGEDCTKACIAMKAIAAQVRWDSFKRKYVASCECFFAGFYSHTHYSRQGQTNCPCGWNSESGYPYDYPFPVKRGDVVTIKDDYERSDCTIIDCDGDDPTLPSRATIIEPWW